MNSEVYCEFLENAFASFSTFELRQNGKAVFWENAIIQQDNARPHVSRETRDFIASKNAVLLPQAPYSPDTNICDRFIFPKLEMERYQMNITNRKRPN